MLWIFFPSQSIPECPFAGRAMFSPLHAVLLQLNVILFHAEEGKKTKRHKKGESDRKRCWEKNGYPLVCVQDSPHVAVLSLQQRLSVAFCVAQWLLNTRPSRRITPASESLQTNTPTHILDSRKTSCLALLLTSPPLIPFPQFHFDGWWRVQSCGPPVLSWCEPKPIWDSISCLPALSTLKTTTIVSWGRKFRTHYSLFRSRPRSKSSPPASICCVVYRVKSAAFAFSIQSIHVLISHACFWSRYGNPQETAGLRNVELLVFVTACRWIWNFILKIK